MLEKPGLPDDQIIDSLNQHYGLQVATLEFLPIGNDHTAWVYRVWLDQDSSYFLKLKRGFVSPAVLTIPRDLYQSGIISVVSPIPSQSGKLSTPLADFNLILYPFMVGKVGMDVGLSTEQYTQFGTILQQIHTANLPSEHIQQVPRESFALNPNWIQVLHAIQQLLLRNTFSDPFEQELAAFWQSHADEITRIITRASELGRLLQTHALPFVVCHADIHTANLIIGKKGQLFIVDWDQIILAPRERDLMFVVYGHDIGMLEDQSQHAFFQGYGDVHINWPAIAYYRYEWVVQEFADFGERVFLMPDLGTATKQEAVLCFKQLFLPNDVIASTYATEAYL